MRSLLLLVFVVLYTLWPAASIEGESFSFAVIVNKANPYDTWAKKDIADFFLKKKTKWPNGETVMPVDLPKDNRLRRSFTKSILNKKKASVAAYWQKQIFSGRAVPPPEKSTEEEVIEFVTTHTYAIGYVNRDALSDNSRVKAVNMQP